MNRKYLIKIFALCVSFSLLLTGCKKSSLQYDNELLFEGEIGSSVDADLDTGSGYGISEEKCINCGINKVMGSSGAGEYYCETCWNSVPYQIFRYCRQNEIEKSGAEMMATAPEVIECSYLCSLEKLKNERILADFPEIDGFTLLVRAHKKDLRFNKRKEAENIFRVGFDVGKEFCLGVSNNGKAFVRPVTGEIEEMFFYNDNGSSSIMLPLIENSGPLKGWYMYMDPSNGDIKWFDQSVIVKQKQIGNELTSKINQMWSEYQKTKNTKNTKSLCAAIIDIVKKIEDNVNTKVKAEAEKIKVKALKIKNSKDIEENDVINLRTEFLNGLQKEVDGQYIKWQGGSHFYLPAADIVDEIFPTSESKD